MAADIASLADLAEPGADILRGSRRIFRARATPSSGTISTRRWATWSRRP